MDLQTQFQRTTLYSGLFLCAAFLAYLIAIYLLTDEHPSQHVLTIYNGGFLLFTVMYIVQENRTRKAIYNVHDLGFFLWILWPILVPYYFVKSRGIVGVAVFLLLVALAMMDSIVYWIWLVLSQDAA